jgi:hypothetical protein
MNQLQNQVVAGALLAFAIQWAKGSRLFPFITAETARVNRWASVALSGLTALGIHVVCSKVDHQCVISWTDGMTIAVGIWHWITQFVFTHCAYKAVVAKQQ